LTKSSGARCLIWQQQGGIMKIILSVLMLFLFTTQSFSVLYNKKHLDVFCSNSSKEVKQANHNYPAKNNRQHINQLNDTDNKADNIDALIEPPNPKKEEINSYYFSGGVYLYEITGTIDNTLWLCMMPLLNFFNKLR
jgi:hypothetical protein